jgi:hypothetical protein
MHQCQSHTEWLLSVHYMCSCGHAEWVHHGTRLAKAGCMHCDCKQYNGETRPLTDHEIRSGKEDNPLETA